MCVFPNEISANSYQGNINLAFLYYFIRGISTYSLFTKKKIQYFTNTGQKDVAQM